MRIELLGTGGYHPTEQRHTMSVLIPELGLAFDAGTSFFRVGRHLAQSPLHVFLSHAHLDHVVGLTYFFSLLHEHPQLQIIVHGEEAKLADLRAHLFCEALFPAAPPYTWSPLVGDALEIGEARVSWLPLPHPGGSLGYLVEHQGQRLAYITDTTAGEGANYEKFIQGVDLLLHECNFPNGYEALAAQTGHSCLTSVVELARRCEVQRLVLFHSDPVVAIDEEQLAAARRIFSCVEIAHDGLTLDI